ncbi:MAG: leucine-rich repeat protein, partial [Clostridia bacterium]|nr:leucine-rich repeat protein [Clostridia bacterium]
QGAFGGCSELTGVILPSSVSSIGAYAFSGCSSLQYLHIPSTVNTIGAKIIENTPTTICSDSILSTVRSYSLRNGYPFRICGNQH